MRLVMNISVLYGVHTFIVVEVHFLGFLLKYFYFMLPNTSTPLHFRGKYCSFYSSTFRRVTGYFVTLHTAHTTTLPTHVCLLES